MGQGWETAVPASQEMTQEVNSALTKGLALEDG